MTTLQETVLKHLPAEFLIRLGAIMAQKRTGSVTLHLKDGKMMKCEVHESTQLT